MKADEIKSDEAEVVPAILHLVETIRDAPESGHYDSSTDTWSDRDYHNSSTKKHSEAH